MSKFLITKKRGPGGLRGAVNVEYIILIAVAAIAASGGLAVFGGALNNNANKLGSGVDGVKMTIGAAPAAPAIPVSPESDFTFDSSTGTITGYTGPGGAVGIPATIGGVAVTSIGDWAFCCNPDLIAVSIPGSVTSVGVGAFDDCVSLPSITVSDSNANYTSLDGVLFNKDLTTLMQYPAGKADSNYTVPNSVKTIDYLAFDSCSGLVSVTIPSSVTKIGDYAFQYCSGLTSASISGGASSSIGDYAFQYCSGLTSANISGGFSSIGDFAFSYCSGLTSIAIPSGVTSIGREAFGDCEKLTSVTIPSGVTSLEEYIFCGCTSLTSVTIPEGVTTIGMEAFGNCPLTSIIVPNSVTYIGDHSFAGTHLTSITIPSSVTLIANDAFLSCSSLKTATFLGAAPTTFGTGVFTSCASGFTINYTTGKAGWTTPIWNGYPTVAK